MAIVYRFAAYGNEGYVHENPKEKKPYKSAGLSSMRTSLEEEIDRLRRAMEHAYQNEQSLTSDIVITVSRKLDRKLNEYMKKRKADDCEQD